MPVTKTFAIEAEPGAIWDTLWSELQGPGAGPFVVEESHRPRSMVITLQLAGLPTRLSYSILPVEDHSEVTADLEPLSVRYRLLQIITLGRMHTEYELLLAQSLSNLKEAVEAAHFS